MQRLLLVFAVVISTIFIQFCVAQNLIADIPVGKNDIWVGLQKDRDDFYYFQSYTNLYLVKIENENIAVSKTWKQSAPNLQSSSSHPFIKYVRRYDEFKMFWSGNSLNQIMVGQPNSWSSPIQTFNVTSSKVIPSQSTWFTASRCPIWTLAADGEYPDEITTIYALSNAGMVVFDPNTFQVFQDIKFSTLYNSTLCNGGVFCGGPLDKQCFVSDVSVLYDKKQLYVTIQNRERTHAEVLYFDISTGRAYFDSLTILNAFGIVQGANSRNGNYFYWGEHVAGSGFEVFRWSQQAASVEGCVRWRFNPANPQSKNIWWKSISLSDESNNGWLISNWFSGTGDYATGYSLAVFDNSKTPMKILSETAGPYGYMNYGLPVGSRYYLTGATNFLGDGSLRLLLFKYNQTNFDKQESEDSLQKVPAPWGYSDTCDNNKLQASLASYPPTCQRKQPPPDCGFDIKCPNYFTVCLQWGVQMICCKINPT